MNANLSVSKQVAHIQSAFSNASLIRHKARARKNIKEGDPDDVEQDLFCRLNSFIEFVLYLLGLLVLKSN